jgi:hypothetical protein
MVAKWQQQYKEEISIAAGLAPKQKQLAKEFTMGRAVG